MKEGDLVRVRAKAASRWPQSVANHGYLWLVVEGSVWDSKLFRCKSLATGYVRWWSKEKLEKADEEG